MDKMILGLDLGIGSVGWAVINEDERRIEDLGVRIFESGEEGASKSADRASQKRRAKRAIRRLTRRRKLRKLELKDFLENIGFLSVEEINQYFRDGGTRGSIYSLRGKALDKKISKTELVGILIHACNYRGYRDFYEQSKLRMDETEASDKEETQMMASYNRFRLLFQKYSYRTAGEMIAKAPEFQTESGRQKIHNSKNGYEYLISRHMIEDEIRMILNHQSLYYDCLQPDDVINILNIMFRQRAFEDGPGANPKDKGRVQAQLRFWLSDIHW